MMDTTEQQRPSSREKREMALLDAISYNYAELLLLSMEGIFDLQPYYEKVRMVNYRYQLYEELHSLTEKVSGKKFAAFAS